MDEAAKAPLPWDCNEDGLIWSVPLAESGEVNNVVAAVRPADARLIVRAVNSLHEGIKMTGVHCVPVVPGQDPPRFPKKGT